ncbi:uncharacterized protein LOC121994297 [Zingiber officinale]|uniref:Uncharacterized protein n=1 Tax=Zingiber officinale TaxID=94328 RepID=A0A8J5L4R2_ZINOF|nr:uncharacterized protein LOC121994297 [Zingiber officinale]KAG6500801.1 hypothetical protein ZIOFF_040656 [Zingiber officinale]
MKAKSFALFARRGPFPFSSTSHPRPTIMYSTEHEDDSPGVVEKARSTAEEFLRQAKEKSDSVGEKAKDAKEGVVKGTQEQKEKLTSKMDSYDKFGKD